MERYELGLLRKTMNKYKIDWYMVPTDDDHQSEYVGDYFKGRQWISGFTGSAGILVAGLSEAYLFTDGRYYVQAEKELAGSGIELMRSGSVGVPTPEEFLIEKAGEDTVVAFDGRVVSRAKADLLKEQLEKKGAFLKDQSLLEEIWEDRPKRSAEPIFILEDKYAGESVEDKLLRLREKMKEYGAEGHVMTSLADIAWLYNLRGNDVKRSPLFLAYTYVTMEEAFLFVQPGTANEEVHERLLEAGVQLEDYDAIYNFLGNREEKTALLDRGWVNSRIGAAFGEKTELIQGANPTTLMKAVKNPIEIANLKSCHLKDGVAVTKFMYWLKNEIKKEDQDLTEMKAADYLDHLRLQIDTCTDLSFETIAAYGENGAIVHYRPHEETCAKLEPKGFLLVDSGGQYLEGTTDITRTIVLGELTDGQKKNFTGVARGMLNLMNAKFLEGCRGVNLDILARGPMWEMGMDYRHGTGHGVGYYLNVHEGPNAFRWKSTPEQADGELSPGMITTDEPGVYLTGEYGIRTENELLCVVDEENEYGRFLKFDTLTYAPIDLEAIEPSYMNEKEKNLLNTYHQQVYEKISPYLTEEERNWLYESTRPVK